MRWRDWLDLRGDPTPRYRPGPPGTLRAEIAPAEGALLKRPLAVSDARP